MTNTLAIMDYSTSQIHLFKFDKDTIMDDEVISKLGFNLDECYWMYGKAIEIVKHVGTFVTPKEENSL